MLFFLTNSMTHTHTHTCDPLTSHNLWLLNLVPCTPTHQHPKPHPISWWWKRLPVQVTKGQDKHEHHWSARCSKHIVTCTRAAAFGTSCIIDITSCKAPAFGRPCRRVNCGRVLPVGGSSASCGGVLYVYRRSKMADGRFILGFRRPLLGSSLF